MAFGLQEALQHATARERMLEMEAAGIRAASTREMRHPGSAVAGDLTLPG